MQCRVPADISPCTTGSPTEDWLQIGWAMSLNYSGKKAAVYLPDGPVIWHLIFLPLSLSLSLCLWLWSCWNTRGRMLILEEVMTARWLTLVLSNQSPKQGWVKDILYSDQLNALKEIWSADCGLFGQQSTLTCPLVTSPVFFVFSFLASSLW